MLKALSRPVHVAKKPFSGQSSEVASLQVFAESAQKHSALAPEQLVRGEVDTAQLVAEVSGLRCGRTIERSLAVGRQTPSWC
jgi:hypothetical protein